MASNRSKNFGPIQRNEPYFELRVDLVSPTYDRIIKIDKINY